MKDFIVANGIVRYKPGIIRYQQHDVANGAEKIIAEARKIIADMEEISESIARCGLSRSQVLSLINTQIKNWSQTNEKANKINLNISPEEFCNICVETLRNI